MLGKPQAILFDMGGVLSDACDRYDADSFPKSFAEGLPEPAPLDWFLAMSSECLSTFLQRPVPRPSIDITPIVARWLTQRGEEPTAERVKRWQDIIEQWEVRPIYPHVPPTLHQLGAMGIRMGVISNTMTASHCLRQHFSRAGILRHFEVTVFSAEFGIGKPHPSIFRHALDTMRLTPDQAWFVGDKPQRDICGAHSVNMTAVLVESAHGHRVIDRTENRPDLRIKDISELPDLLISTLP